jgi:hypothetical protein
MRGSREHEIMGTDRKKEFPSGLEEWAASERMRKEIRETAGRLGMLERDFEKFVPHAARLWTKRELKNRIAYLKDQRRSLLGKPEKLQDLEKNRRKLEKYTKELFRRESTRNQKKEREEYNAKRRRARAIAKRRRLKALADAAWARRRKAKIVSH